ncbi:MAG TPA: hypothetical protein VGF43_14585 [Dongiaceae bacterium]|jgi:hypothetical protein
MRSLGDNEVLALPIAAAEAMPDDELRAIFIEMVVTLDGEMGDSLPEEFPSRAVGHAPREILAAVRKYPCWFDYHGHQREQSG